MDSKKYIFSDVNAFLNEARYVNVSPRMKFEGNIIKPKISILTGSTMVPGINEALILYNKKNSAKRSSMKIKFKTATKKILFFVLSGKNLPVKEPANIKTAQKAKNIPSAISLPMNTESHIFTNNI
jgi:hypothetical protein